MASILSVKQISHIISFGTLMIVKHARNYLNLVSKGGEEFVNVSMQ